jgi:hypothetical protein
MTEKIQVMIICGGKMIVLRNILLYQMEFFLLKVNITYIEIIGDGGQIIYVIPYFDMVIVHMTNTSKP